ncbi:MAG: hypothetical protein IH825_04185 [Candidatus Marinimicrobia bacterium]|nr:hypothetical protein [Candidatus Neomarinimicrobiota bacterium]
MTKKELEDIAKQWNGDGAPCDLTPHQSKLLLGVYRDLAKGEPVSTTALDKIIEEIGIDNDEANDYLKTITERDSDGNILGILGLSLNKHPHEFIVNGNSFNTWCAIDALFIPPMLNKTATVKSISPLSKGKIELRVSPEKVEEVSPDGVAVSIVTLKPDEETRESVAKIWSNYCHNIFFFSSEEEGKEWAEGKENIEIVSVHEAYELGKKAYSKVLKHA